MRNVRPADILLFKVTASSNLLDKMIGWGQKLIHEAPSKASYYHVGLVGPDVRHYYESAWPRIHNTALGWLDIERTIAVEVYRVKDITADQVVQVLTAAQTRVGQWYDAMTLLTFGHLQIGKAAVCSQYVWECFTAADICLTPFENLESPDDIAASKKLVLVE